MPRNKKTLLPKGHPRKYTSNGALQNVSQEKLIQHHKDLVAAGKLQAEKAAAAAIAAANAKAEQSETAYDELYSTARKGLMAAGRNALAMTEGAQLLRKAKDEAYKLLVSDHNLDMRDDYGKLDLSAACALSDVHKKIAPLARAAADTRPLAHALCELRTTHKRSLAQ